MGKRIIQQARGKGSHTYRVKKKAFRYKLKYPRDLQGEGTVIKLLNSPAHSSPLAKIKCSKGTFYIPAFDKMIEGQKINFEKSKIEKGSILKLKEIPIKTKIYNIESRPNDGGVFIKSAGNSAIINRITEGKVFIKFPSKKEKQLHSNCRAIVGVIAGAGRTDKPIVKAGKQHHNKK